MSRTSCNAQALRRRAEAQRAARRSALQRTVEATLRCVRGAREKSTHTHPRHCERSEAIQSLFAEGFWIASSQALLAMTEQGATSPLFQHAFPIADTPSRSRGAIRPSFADYSHPLNPRERREGRVLTTHPRSAAQNAHAEEPHSSIQVVPITRPSLRDGRTAYAALSREPSSLWPPSPRRKSPAPRRLTRLPHSQGLDRSNDGQDHTVLPYARPAISPQFSRPCRRSRKLAGETKPDSAVRPRDAKDSRRAIRPAPAFRARRCRVHRKPGSRT